MNISQSGTLKGGNVQLSKDILAQIHRDAAKLSRPIVLMHICGTHEYTIAKNGLRSIFPPNIQVIPGPGCPVCVCSTNDIDAAIEIAHKPNVILTSFGDMIRVPATTSSLEEARSKGADVRIVYGPNDAVELAQKYPDKEVVFFAIGFETTAPLAAFELCNQPPKNFSVISAHKLVPPAFDLLLGVEKMAIDGFLLPGHVSAIIGADAYLPYMEKYRMPMVIGGFEVNDVLISILYLIRQILKNQPAVENTYTRVVKPEGNPVARDFIQRAFEPIDTVWRGIGLLPNSGLAVRQEWADHDALKKFGVKIDPTPNMPAGCLCSEVLIGQKKPEECPLFGTSCLPEHPIGPCMVSHEGTCKITYQFRSD
jgi:hydrogenase expression/formation protein HypD